jgi:hypothetical protein
MGASRNDLVECLSNLKLGSSNEDTERSERLWSPSTVEFKLGVEKLWLDGVGKGKEKLKMGIRNPDPIYI